MLNTLEMLEAISKNPKAVFVSKQEPDNPVKFVNGALRWKSGEVFELNLNSILNEWTTLGGTLDVYKWELVREPVNFMEAVKAFNDKTTIECRMLGLGEKKVYKPSEHQMRAITDQHGTAVTSEEILNGKWYIKD